MDRYMKMNRGARQGAIALAATAVLLLSACGQKSSTQVAARVNDDEITISQVNFVLQQQHNVRPDQVDAASHQLLEKLIDQELAAQQAAKLKLDKDPQTLQMIEAARREIIARRYVDSIVEGVPKPSAADIQKYYLAHPALFGDRKIYTFERTDVQVPATRGGEVAAHAQAAKSAGELTDWLKSQGLKFTESPLTQPAESLPLQLIDRIGEMKPGTSIALPQPFGVSVLTLVSAESAPKTQEEARAPIEQYLTTQARRDAVTSATKGLREGAKIEYQGKFAASAPAPGGSAPAGSSANAAVPATTSASSSSAVDADSLKKGLNLK